ncbi:MAG TPA: vanadium-dependent haloperoxidase [Terriglobales bacterium]|nr:vanadium-dependent haloperoxidase [Terriglobales bacterium]
MNHFRKYFCNWLIAFAVLAAPAVAAADVVTEWNEKALACATTAKQLPFAGARTMAMVHTAMFDAVNSIEGRYTPYKVKESAPPGSSPEAAAIAAAHAVLLNLFPDQKTDLDAAYTASMAQVPDGSGKAAGIAVGEKVAAEILALRASDGADAPNTYRPTTAPGVYVMTTLPIGSQWGSVTPWAMERGSQFRPEAPPQLTSPEWASDYNEIKGVGRKKSTLRTSEQTDIARFWTITGPASWDPIVRQLAATPGRSLIENARLFALVEIATADAYIAVFDAKYTFNFWRPITAIRNGDIDGNDATEREPDWEPAVDTPLHPEYPCAHCITSSAAATVLESEFGTGPVRALTMTSSTAPGVVRKWITIRQWADEVSSARIYGGIHYRNSTVVGKAMGRKIGELAAQQYLQPVH